MSYFSVILKKGGILLNSRLFIISLKLSFCVEKLLFLFATINFLEDTIERILQEYNISFENRLLIIVTL